MNKKDAIWTPKLSWLTGNRIMETLAQYYRIWLTVQYEDQFSEYKKSLKRRRIEWRDFIDRLPVKLKDDQCLIQAYMVFPELWSSQYQLPSKEIASLILDSAGLHCMTIDQEKQAWVNIIEVVYSNQERLEQQRLTIEKDYLI